MTSAVELFQVRVEPRYVLEPVGNQGPRLLIFVRFGAVAVTGHNQPLRRRSIS